MEAVKEAAAAKRTKIRFFMYDIVSSI